MSVLLMNHIRIYQCHCMSVLFMNHTQCHCMCVTSINHMWIHRCHCMYVPLNKPHKDPPVSLRVCSFHEPHPESVHVCFIHETHKDLQCHCMSFTSITTCGSTGVIACL